MRDWRPIMWRSAVVLASAAAFIRSLTETAFVTECCYALRGARGFSGLEMLVTGWMGVLQLDPLLFVSIVAAWVCTCAPDRREEACSASDGHAQGLGGNITSRVGR
jgi:hypothetical protein